MAVSIHDLILQAKQLPRRQRIVLMAALSDSLLEEEQPLLSEGDFWASKSLEELNGEQGTQPLSDWHQFVANDVWPEGESLDEFEQFQEQERARDIKHVRMSDESP